LAATFGGCTADFLLLAGVTLSTVAHFSAVSVFVGVLVPFPFDFAFDFARVLGFFSFVFFDPGCNFDFDFDFDVDFDAAFDFPLEFDILTGVAAPAPAPPQTQYAAATPPAAAHSSAPACATADIRMRATTDDTLQIYTAALQCFLAAVVCLSSKRAARI
jgi:hypothetical protein